MANARMKNLAGLFTEGRTRVIIIVTAILLIIGVVIGISMIKRHGPGPAEKASVQGAPTLASVPGGFDKQVTAQYAKLVEQQNVQKAETASKGTTSAMPTIIRSGSFQQGGQLLCPCPAPAEGGPPEAGMSFSALGRLAREEGRTMPLTIGGVPSAQKGITGVVCADGTIRDEQGNIVGRTTRAAAGTPVYDAQGRLIGTVGADGLVRDANGNVIGTVGADGIVRDPNGKIIGATGSEAQALAANRIVRDANGNVIGTVGADGKVRDAAGKVIGAVDSNGVVRDENGNVLGTAAGPLTEAAARGVGKLVYDDKGNVIGVLGADGKVRDANGKLIGTVGADGIVRDAAGKVIGKPGTSPPGALAYDAKGRLLGVVGPDGKIRDASGKVVGTVGSDGTVLGLNGKPIGKVSTAALPGNLVYDKDGRVLGSVGPDGKVRDANGNVVGTVGPDGIVRDAKGNVIGKSGGPAPGTGIYDANGKLIGTVGPDGLVRDANGNVIGMVGADGVVRDAKGNVIGKASYVAPGTQVAEAGGAMGTVTAAGTVTGIAKPNAMSGTPVYDANGKLIGMVGADGKVRDANGNVVGTIGADGMVRDASGRVVGKAAPTRSSISTELGPLGALEGAESEGDGAPPVAAIPAVPGGVQMTAPPPGVRAGETRSVLERQAAMISEQKMEQLKQQLQAGMMAQASQLFSAWAPPTQAYVEGTPELEKSGLAGAGGVAGLSAAGGLAGGAMKPPIVKAGTVMFAVLETSLNSDEPGPIMAEIVSGTFKGGRLLGTLANQGQKVLLNFNLLNMPNYSSSISINAIAIDPETARTALSSHTDNHYLLRYGSLFAASFLQGYAQAVSQSGATISTNLFNTVTNMPTLSGGDKIVVALGNVGTQYANYLSSIYSTPPTVYVNAGTGMGILFVSDVVSP